MTNRGFTLIEILIAMAIFAMIGLASSAVLTTVLNSDEISQQRLEKLQRLQRAMLIIERDIQQAVPRAVRSNTGSNQVVMRGGETQSDDTYTLSFVRSGWQNPQMMLPRSTLQSVAYRLKDGKLERLYTNYVDNVIGTEPKVRILLDNISEFRVQFVADAEEETSFSNSDSAQINWRDAYVGGVLPKAVAFEIVSEDFGRIRREFSLGGAVI